MKFFWETDRCKGSHSKHQYIHLHFSTEHIVFGRAGTSPCKDIYLLSFSHWFPTQGPLIVLCTHMVTCIQIDTHYKFLELETAGSNRAFILEVAAMSLPKRAQPEARRTLISHLPSLRVIKGFKHLSVSRMDMLHWSALAAIANTSRLWFKEQGRRIPTVLEAEGSGLGSSLSGSGGNLFLECRWFLLSAHTHSSKE